jgi:hypothetical protein
VSLRELSSAGPVHTWRLGAPVTCVRFHPDGRPLVAVTGQWRSDASGAMYVIQPGSTPEVQAYPFDQPVGAVEFSGPDDVVVLGGWDGTVTYVRLADGARLAQVAGSKNTIAAAAFTPDAESFVPLSLAAARQEELRRQAAIPSWPMLVPSDRADVILDWRE